MSISIKGVEPAIFADNDSLHAFFTLKNKTLTQGRSVPGLNMGFNTSEKREVVEQNRRLLLQKLDIDPAWIAYAQQVHSNRVQVVTEGGTFSDTDALITQIPGLALAIQVADCAALLLADTSSGLIAAVHAGWRGAAGDIVPRTLKKMKELGAQSSSLRAFISPCICVDHFEVGEEVAEQFPDSFVDYKSYQKPHINLKAFLKDQLMQGGVAEEHVEIHPGCTIEDAGQYYSYRREKEQSGRMLAVIQLKNR